MKKVLAILLAVVLVLTLAACGGGTAGGGGGGGGGGTQPEFILNLGDVLAETHPHSQAFFWFADRVHELTDGRVQVNVFVNSALGSQAELIEGLHLGTVQIAKSMTTGLAVYVPEIQIFDLPYMFTDLDHFFRVIDGEIGAYYANEVLGREDMIGIAYFYAGARSVYTNRPVHTLADLNGMLLRVPGSPIFMSLADSFGAAGTPMAVGEIFMALQTGVVDGAENAPIFYYQQRHHEVAPYFTFTEHIITPDVVVMSRSFLESLPQDIQEAILQAAQEMSMVARNLWFELEETVFESLEADGVTFIEVDKAPFMEAARVVWDDFRDIVGQDAIDRIQALA